MRTPPGRLARLAVVVTALCALAVPLACGGEDSEFVDSLCTAGESKCLGNTVALCAPDGKSWQYSPCGNQSCQAAACVARACQYLGGGICISDSKATLCPESGLSTDEITCSADETCVGGGCRKAACKTGEKICGYRATLECVAGAWQQTDCAAGEICAVTAGAPACTPTVCTPQLAVCDGSVSKVCNAQGSATADTTCGGSQICKGGYCQAKVAGVDDGPDATPDASGDLGGQDVTPDIAGDTASDTAGPDAEVFIPPLEKISKIAFKLGGISNSFDLGAGADYIPADSLLKVSAGKGTRKIEINFAPIDPFVVDNFDDTDSTGVTVIICYFDGVTPQPKAPNCPDGFSHSSTLYKATLTENNGEGSRVVGTFEATLEDAQGTKSQLTEGTFDVLHK
ncbi:MAG: hypothetical protein R3F39_02530 [Myxococcota bacterium]